MSKLTGTLASLTLESKAYLDFFDKKMTEILKSAVKVWLATAVNKIPVWSGSSQATLLKLAEKVDFPLSIFPVSRVYPDGRVRNVPDQTAEGKAASQGELIIDRARGKYGFLWSVEHDHHLSRNENVDMRPYGFHLITPGPYHFRNVADKAFRSEVTKLMRGFRYDIKKFIKVKTINFG